MSKRLAYPYIGWAVLFTVLPLIMIFLFAFYNKSTGEFTLENIERLQDPVVLKQVWNSFIIALKLSVITTVLCLLIAYPLAMILASKDYVAKGFLVTVFVLPMWMNFLVRTYALMSLLETNGLVNNFLSLFGMEKIVFLGGEGAITLGMVYNYLPFMLLPIHSVLQKIDKKYMEAAQDLGCNTWQVFRRVTFPLSLSGVISGITMVFVPSITTFAISEILGQSNILLIGDLINYYFVGEGNDWGLGALLSAILMVIILLTTMVPGGGEESSEKRGVIG
ncbi:MAG: ABC transporter permease [Clostridia bacterium]|nr:ABC transporter permease [Clostridia bacterium]